MGLRADNFERFYIGIYVQIRLVILLTELSDKLMTRHLSVKTDISSIIQFEYPLSVRQYAPKIY